MEKVEPLNHVEQVVYDNLQDHLKIPYSEFEKLTDIQKLVAARVIVRQGYGVKSSAVMGIGADKYLGIQFPHIFIGIETDGYAHS